jgi:hypothetical protein
MCDLRCFGVHRAHVGCAPRNPGSLGAALRFSRSRAARPRACGAAGRVCGAIEGRVCGASARGVAIARGAAGAR